jgi:DNA-binding transcriptional LysR family regulator
MNIETLKIFCDLVETQSFSLAAKRNFVTQSAVSQRISNLEGKFNGRLINRVRGKGEIKLTKAGKVFYAECSKVLASYEELNENMRFAIKTDLRSKPVRRALRKR